MSTILLHGRNFFRLGTFTVCNTANLVSFCSICMQYIYIQTLIVCLRIEFEKQCTFPLSVILIISRESYDLYWQTENQTWTAWWRGKYVLPILWRGTHFCMWQCYLQLLKKWVGQLVEGLNHAHSNDVLHCNIKPNNILLSSPNSLVLGMLQLKQLHVWRIYYDVHPVQNVHVYTLFAILTGDFAVPVVMENMREVVEKRGGIQ